MSRGEIDDSPSSVLLSFLSQNASASGIVPGSWTSSAIGNGTMDGLELRRLASLQTNNQ